MPAFEYHVAYIDFRGRISAEGREMQIANERRTTFVRRYLDDLGRQGWELVGIQPLSPNSAYYTFKRPASGGPRAEASSTDAPGAGAPHEPPPSPGAGPASWSGEPM
jgi:hypothetical protein